MVKVITYGTYDLLHYGHKKLLERAKALGDYLIVGVTSDDFDKTRGKINNQQSLMERMEAIRATGIADEVIVEEYEGQKIDDILKYDIDIFAIGSDWVGKFDYLNEFCKVVYLPRTEGISSTELRASKNHIRVGIIGDTDIDLTSISKFMREVQFVNGIEPVAILGKQHLQGLENIENEQQFIQMVDAVYVVSHPSTHYKHVRFALENGKHVLCESPISLKVEEYKELISLAKQHGSILFDGIKTAYATAYERLLLLVKSGKIGEVVSVDSVCTSVKALLDKSNDELSRNWNTITEWGPPGLLPVFQILGTDFQHISISSKLLQNHFDFDIFTKIDITYQSAVASVRIGKGVKSEGELIISGTKGYIVVPAPWWKTDYFEVRYENPADNKRYFYQLDGEGIRYEIVAFAKAIQSGKGESFINRSVSQAICSVMEEFYSGNVYYLNYNQGE